MMDDARIDALLSRQQLADLSAAYCRGVDRADSVLLSTLFHEESIMESGPFNGSGQQFATEICAIVRQVFSQTSHATAHQWIEIEGDRAKGESYVIAVATPRVEEGEAMPVVTGGRYIDRFRRDDGIWRFAERRFVCDWVIRQPAGGGEELYAGFLRGARSPDDPVERLWKGDAA